MNVQVGSSAAASMDISPLIEAFEGMMGSVPQLQQLFSQAGAQAARPAETAAPAAAAAAAPAPATADAQAAPLSTPSTQPAGTASSVHKVASLPAAMCWSDYAAAQALALYAASGTRADGTAFRSSSAVASYWGVE